MSAAVEIKPRAKSAKKVARPLTPQQAMAEVCKLLNAAEQLIDQAREVGAPGDLGERLMRIAVDPMLTDLFEKLQPDAFSQHTVEAAIDSLGDLQGVISGAAALHAGDARGLLMREAFEHTERAYELLDPDGVAKFWPAEPQITQKHLDQQRQDFLDGHRTALELMRHADRLDGTDEAAAKRWYRGGKAQNRFARTYLKWLMDNPETLEGFAAVLSAKLTCGDNVDAEAWNVPMAEFEAGEPGADGTEADTSDDPPQPLTAEELAAANGQPTREEIDADDKAWRSLAVDANYQIQKLAEMLKAVNDGKGPDHDAAMSGIASRIVQLTDIVYFAAELYDDEADVVPTLKELRSKFEGGL